jgi:hypothetical protein
MTQDVGLQGVEMHNILCSVGIIRQTLNQGQGGIYMEGRLKDRAGRSSVPVSLGLEDGLATLFDLLSPID